MVVRSILPFFRNEESGPNSERSSGYLRLTGNPGVGDLHQCGRRERGLPGFAKPDTASLARHLERFAVSVASRTTTLRDIRLHPACIHRVEDCVGWNRST